MTSASLYCKIYVDSESERSKLVESISTVCLGAPSGRTVTSREMIIDVCRNEDFDPALRAGPDGFIHFRYYLDVQPSSGVGEKDFIAAVGRFLDGFRVKGIHAVTAADFEAELPNQGRT
jgi:hypothetical protein